MSNYLSDSKAFENAISRNKLSYRSSELKVLVKAIADYTRGKTRQGIVDVKDCWQEWKEKDPKEFADRGIALASDFEKELKGACDWLGVDFDEDEDEDWDAPAIPKARTVVVNRHKLMKKTAKYTASLGATLTGPLKRAWPLPAAWASRGLSLEVAQHSAQQASVRSP